MAGPLSEAQLARMQGYWDIPEVRDWVWTD